MNSADIIKASEIIKGVNTTGITIETGEGNTFVVKQVINGEIKYYTTLEEVEVEFTPLNLIFSNTGDGTKFKNDPTRWYVMCDNSIVFEPRSNTSNRLYVGAEFSARVFTDGEGLQVVEFFKNK
jgi:hypothetical protein